jgi:AcrR family transcriptional regulator
MAKRGRPASFDRAKALQSAMELFWARGYEGTTLEDLLAAMGGITPPSFYHAFGSKEALFREAVDLYVTTIGGLPIRALNETATTREAIEAMLRLTAEGLSQRGKPHGCMMVLGATNCTPSGKAAQDYLRAFRLKAPEIIKQRLKRGVAEGDLPPGADVDGIASFYVTMLHGLGFRGGDGATRAALMAAVDGAMAAWAEFTAPRHRRGEQNHKRRGRGDAD